jgi:cysteine dioxygenase
MLLKAYQDSLEKNVIDQLLNDILKAKDKLTLTFLNKLLEVNIEVGDVEKWVIFSENHYQRNRVIRFPDIEMLVVCWRPGQYTPIHDHAGSICTIKVLTGTLTEIIFEKNSLGYLLPTQKTEIKAGKSCCSIDESIHLVGNFEANNTDLITLHCYSPPLDKINLFGLESTIFGNYTDFYNEYRCS